MFNSPARTLASYFKRYDRDGCALDANGPKGGANSSGEATVKIDLHGYHPGNVTRRGLLLKLVRQAWECGENELEFIHGHGRNRGLTPGFVNTNTGYLGLEVRRGLQNLAAKLRSLRNSVNSGAVSTRWFFISHSALRNETASETKSQPESGVTVVFLP